MRSAFTAKDITEPEPIEPEGQNSSLAIPATGEQEAKGTNVPSTHAPKQVTATNGNPIETSHVREPITQKSGADQSPAAQLIEKKDAPAISRITNLPTPSRNLRFNDTLIVLTHPDGTQIKVPPVENLHRHRVPNLTLAQAVLKHYETHLPKPSELPRIRRLFLSTDHNLAAKLTALAAKTHQQPENMEDGGSKTDNVPTDIDGNLAGTF